MPPMVHLGVISIHALREEGDTARNENHRENENFNPRPPRGGRLDRSHQLLTTINISIHALREEGDCKGLIC